MTRRHRLVLRGVSSAIAIALVIAFSLAMRPLGAAAASLEAESPAASSAETPPYRAEQPAQPTPAGIADLASLAFIALLWGLSNKAARHRSIRPRRHARSAAA